MKLRIYIIEDEQYQCLMLEEMLIQKNNEVVGFTSSGEEALDDIILLKNENQLPHLLFLDMDLRNGGGKWNGVDLLRELWKYNIKIPFVVISQYTGYEEKLRAFSNFEIDFISKGSDLEESINYVLNKYWQMYGYIKVTSYNLIDGEKEEPKKIYYKEIICVCSLKYAARYFGEESKDGNNVVIYYIEEKQSERKKIIMKEKNPKTFLEECNYPNFKRLEDRFILNKDYKIKGILTPKPYVKMRYFDNHDFNIGGMYKEDYTEWL